MGYEFEMKGYGHKYHQQYLEGFAAVVNHSNEDAVCPYDKDYYLNEYNAWQEGKSAGIKNLNKKTQ